MKYLSEETTAGLITVEMAFEAAEQALKAAATDGKTFPVVIAKGPVEASSFSLKSASAHGLTGWKTGSYWGSNIDKGIPCHGSTIFLLDPETGKLDAVIEASQVNAYRTAAADAVAVNCLARSDARRLAVFGTGHQAFYECQAISHIRAIAEILVVGRTPDKAEEFVKKLNQAGYTARTSEAEAAVSQADIITTATLSDSPLFHVEWVRPGTHISAMGADSKGKQELPPDLFPNAGLFCDLASQSTVIGEFQHSQNLPLTLIGECLLGRHPGRENDQQITIFNSSGISLQDIFVARKLLAAAEERGLVREVF